MKRIGFLFTDCGSFVRLPEDVIMAEIPDSKDKRFTDARGFMSPSIAELVATKAERERGCILLLCKLDIRIFSILPPSKNSGRRNFSVDGGRK